MIEREIKHIIVDDKDVVQDFLESLQPRDFKKVKWAIDRLKEKGMELVNSGMVSHVLGGYNNLWYLRINYRTNTYRIFFCEYNELIVLLHGFKKKTPKIPQSEIDKAQNRKQSLFNK